MQRNYLTIMHGHWITGVRMARKQEANKRLRDGQLALWALELVYPYPPQKQGNVARGSGTMAIQPDGTVCIDGSEVQLNDE